MYKKYKISKSALRNYMERCNALPFLVDNASLLNRIFGFVYPDLAVDYCDLDRVKITTRCRTTLETLIYVLVGEIFPDKFKETMTTSYKQIMQIVDNFGLVVLSSISEGDFPGHILAIIKISDTVYFILQSYIDRYELEITVANAHSLELFLEHYLSLFREGTLNIDEWEKLTGVREDNLEGAIIPYVTLYYLSYNYKVNHVGCTEYVRSVVNQATRLTSDEDKIADLYRFFGDLYDDPDSEVLQSFVQADLIDMLNGLDNMGSSTKMVNYLDQDGYLLPEKMELVMEPYPELNSDTLSWIVTPYEEFTAHLDSSYTVEDILNMPSSSLRAFYFKFNLRGLFHPYPILTTLYKSGLLHGKYTYLVPNPEFAVLCNQDIKEVISLAREKGLVTAYKTKLEMIAVILK